MDTYRIVVLCHVVLTLLAFIFGLMAIWVTPKGGIVHKKAGRLYYYFYLGVVLTGYIMIAIKFKIFFLGLTLFGTYLILAGNYFAKSRQGRFSVRWWLLSILILTIFVHVIDLAFAISNLDNIGYGWFIVRVIYAIIPVLVLIYERMDKSTGYLRHAVMMILSFIPLVEGLLARISPVEYVWVFWMLGYAIFIPLFIWWFKTSKSLQPFWR